MANGKGEKTDKPSLTRPNMNLTIKQLLKNHTRGLHNEVHEYPRIFTGEVAVPLFQDMTEFYDWKQNLFTKASDFAKENMEAHLEAAEKRLRNRLKIDEEGNPVSPAESEGQE